MSNVNLISILIGLEQIYDNPAIKNLRLYLQDPLKDKDVERSLFLFKSLEYNPQALKHLQTYMLDTIAHQDSEKILPLLKTFLTNDNETLFHSIKCYLLDPIDSRIAEKLLPLFKILDSAFSQELLHQIKCSIVNPDDTLSIFKTLFLSGIEDQFINNLSKAITSYPNVNWNDSFSKGQLFSKLWLIDEVEKLNLDLGTTFVCAGWLGTLAALIMKNGKIKYNCFRSFDIDGDCEQAADQLNRFAVTQDWKFKATTLDIFDVNYENHKFQCWSKVNNRMSHPVETIPDTIINTSCDHINPFNQWWNLIPAGKLVILQNNNSKIDDTHINVVSSIEDMKQQAPMSRILYEGILPFPDYTRFMLIGIK